jgi:hypothetical protein
MSTKLAYAVVPVKRFRQSGRENKRVSFLSMTSRRLKPVRRRGPTIIHRIISCVVVTVACAVPTLAQFQQEGEVGYHSIACIKVKPEKSSEFRAWAASDLHKYAQSRVDTAVLSGWFLARSVQPQGTSAECDYLAISMYPTTPPEPLSPEALDEVLKKAGLTMTGQQFIVRRDSLATLVSNSLYQNRASVGGSPKTGNYLVLNYRKAAKVDDWIAFEKEVWRPVAEAMVKDGKMTGWSLNVQVLPGGTDLKFQGVTMDVYARWDDVFKDDPQSSERFKRVHPNRELGATFEQVQKLRTLVSVQLFTAIDAVTPIK